MRDIDGVMHILERHPAARTGVLLKLADRARAQLDDVPTLATWNLESDEGPDSVSALVGAIDQCDDRRKARWHASAMLLLWCLRAIPRAEQLRTRDLLAIQRLATKADSERGYKQRMGASEGGKTRSKWKDNSGEMQEAINALHLERPGVSYEELKRLAQRRHGYPLSALKRYTKNPRK